MQLNGCIYGGYFICYEKADVELDLLKNVVCAAALIADLTGFIVASFAVRHFF